MYRSHSKFKLKYILKYILTANSNAAKRRSLRSPSVRQRRCARPTAHFKSDRQVKLASSNPS